MTTEDWRSWLATGEEDGERSETLRRNTYKGLPSGDEAFVTNVELLIGRRLRERPPGRPRREQVNA